MKISRARLMRFQHLHTWAGIVAGWLLFAAFFAGAFAIFEEELTQWSQLPLQVAQGPGDADALFEAYRQQTAKPSDSIQLLFDGAQDGVVQLVARQEDGTLQGYILSSTGALTPTPAVPVSARGGAITIGKFFDLVHRKGALPISLSWADWIIGAVSLLYGLAVVSGVVILLPTLLRDLLTLRFHKGPRRKWLDTHTLMSLTSLPFHVVIVVSAVVFYFHGSIYAIQSQLFFDGKRPFARERVEQSAGPAAAVPAPTSLVALAAHEAPGGKVTRLEYRNIHSAKPSARLSVQDPRYFTRRPGAGFLTVDLKTGKIDKSLAPDADTPQSATLATAFALHFGSFGGMAGKLLYVVMGVLGAFVFYTGNLAWIEARRKRNHAGKRLDSRRDSNVISWLTAGFCFGTVMALPAALLAVRWSANAAQGVNTLANSVFYAVLLGCMALAWRWGDASHQRLRRIAALVYVLIPATSVLQFWGAGVAMTAHTAWIDALALGGALILAGRVRTKRTQRVLAGQHSM